MTNIYQEVASDLGLSTAIVESIGMDVLSSLRQKLNGPTEIAYELPKLGTFTLRHKKYESFHRHLIRSVGNGRYVLGENYPEDMYQKNLRLMELIEDYRRLQYETKKAKDKAREESKSKSD